MEHIDCRFTNPPLPRGNGFYLFFIPYMRRRTSSRGDSKVKGDTQLGTAEVHVLAVGAWLRAGQLRKHAVFEPSGQNDF